MAKRIDLQQAFKDPDETNAGAADGEQQEPRPAATKKTPAKKTAAGRKPTGTKAAAKKAGGSGKGRGEQPRPAKKAATPARPRTEPQVKGVKVTEAKRVSLYVHQDDYEWMKYELRGGDLQAVMRSMIAVCRNSPRLAEQVARLSRTAPRGEH